jgi:hypothetical protein
MPRVLTMTQKPGETPDQFAARISGQASKFFDESAQPPTDVPADQQAPQEESAPPS